MYHELKRIQEYEHPHYFRSKHEAAMHLRNSWDETGKEAHARRTNTRLVSKILKTSHRFLSWYSTLLETAEISRYFEMCLLTLELSRSSCQMLPQHQNPSPKNRLLRPSSTRPQVAAQPGTQYSRAKGGFGTTRTGGTKSGKTNAKQDNG